MTIHLAPLHSADHDTSVPHAKVPWIAHGLVFVAMALVATAVAAHLGLDRGIEPMLAAAAGFGVVALGGVIHTVVSRTRGTTAPAYRRAPTSWPRPGDSVPGGTVPGGRELRDPPLLRDEPVLRPDAGRQAEAYATAGRPDVEASELALALMAGLHATTALGAEPPAVTDPAAAGLDMGQDWSRNMAGAPVHYPPAAALPPGAQTPVLSSLSLAAAGPPPEPYDFGRPFDPLHRFAEPSRHPAALTGPVGGESEFERVERLVRRLADHVNQLDAAQASQPQPMTQDVPAPTLDHAPPLPSEDTASRQIAASINALRRINEAEAAAYANPAPVPPAPVPAADPAASAPPPGPAARPRDWLEPAASDVFDPGEEAQKADIVSAINGQRIDVYLEPILDLAGQRPRHYEVTIGLRTAAGETIDLTQVATDLSGTGLLPLIETARIVRAGQVARRFAERGKAGSIFTDLNGETLDEPGFQEAFAAGEPAGAFPGQMVLTLPQAHVRTFTAADWYTLARLQAAGFGFALGDVTSLDMDFAGLARAGFAFARLDAQTFLDGLPLGEMAVPPPDICRHLAACGMTLIVGGILDDHQLARIFGFGVLFGQGQLFGGVRPMQTLAGPAAVAAE